MIIGEIGAIMLVLLGIYALCVYRLRQKVRGDVRDVVERYDNAQRELAKFGLTFNKINRNIQPEYWWVDIESQYKLDGIIISTRLHWYPWHRFAAPDGFHIDVTFPEARFSGLEPHEYDLAFPLTVESEIKAMVEKKFKLPFRANIPAFQNTEPEKYAKHIANLVAFLDGVWHITLSEHWKVRTELSEIIMSRRRILGRISEIRV